VCAARVSNLNRFSTKRQQSALAVTKASTWPARKQERERSGNEMLAMGMAGQAHTSIDITSLCGHVYGFPKKRLLSIQHQRREIGGILGDSKTPLPLTP